MGDLRDDLAAARTAEVNRVARLLMAEWERVEERPVTASYVATFADLARAVIADQAGREAAAAAAVARARALADEYENMRLGYKAASGYLDRFRDVLADALGFADENPGDDVLIATLREHFGRTGPEPTRWRDFVGSTLIEAGMAAPYDVTADALDGAGDDPRPVVTIPPVGAFPGEPGYPAEPTERSL